MARISVIIFGLLASICFYAAPSHGDGAAALYAPPPPESAAFIRTVATEKVGATAGLASDSLLVPIELVPGVGAYHPIINGQHKFLVGDVSVTVTLVAGSYYSLVIHDDRGLKLQFVSDPIVLSRFHGQIALHNLTGLPVVWLSWCGEKTHLGEPVASGGVGKLRIYPAVRNIAVVSAGGQLGCLLDTILRRHETLSIFAIVEGDEITIMAASAREFAD
ncbi:MAG: alginate O-acetyltransferase AlgF [Proteobacteria bacterium]|nr:alginate O-acetyltransferase AlgF [Pseudomonadota bacterium]